MITVSFYRRNGSIVKVRAAGHSGLAEHGNDVLCAAASALVQTAYLAIAEIADGVTYKRDAKDGLFEFCISETCSQRHDVDVILRALIVGLNDLHSGYPQNIKTEDISCL